MAPVVGTVDPLLLLLCCLRTPPLPRHSFVVDSVPYTMSFVMDDNESMVPIVVQIHWTIPGVMMVVVEEDGATPLGLVDSSVGMMVVEVLVDSVL